MDRGQVCRNTRQKRDQEEEPHRMKFEDVTNQHPLPSLEIKFVNVGEERRQGSEGICLELTTRSDECFNDTRLLHDQRFDDVLNIKSKAPRTEDSSRWGWWGSHTH